MNNAFIRLIYPLFFILSYRMKCFTFIHPLLHLPHPFAWQIHLSSGKEYSPTNDRTDLVETSVIERASKGSSSSFSSSYSWEENEFKPYFAINNEDNITAQLGRTAHLRCKIRNLANRTVSWMRQHDLQILTVGRYTYTSDQRFTCLNLENSDDWTLEVKYVLKEDAGVYECQINTEPKMSLSIRLTVIASKAIIPEGPELWVKNGDTIRLTCIIYESSSPSLYIFWYFKGTVINYDSPRGGIKVTTERGVSTISHLEILDAKSSDSGEYSCKPSFANFANITIHIMEGDELVKQNLEVNEVNHDHISNNVNSYDDVQIDRNKASNSNVNIVHLILLNLIMIVFFDHFLFK